MDMADIRTMVVHSIVIERSPYSGDTHQGDGEFDLNDLACFLGHSLLLCNFEFIHKISDIDEIIHFLKKFSYFCGYCLS